ncbi:MAG: DUF3857 domain-containing protein [Verrucomicrobia bacterium]|nr:DUF3857 domain-containing protein [Verrucomicrobiota bacterium]
MRKSPLLHLALTLPVLLVCLANVSAAPARTALDRQLDEAIAALIEAPASPQALLHLYAISGFDRTASRDGRIRASYTWVLHQPTASPVLKAHALWLLADLDRQNGDLLGAAEKHRELGLITDWLVIGPFDNEGRAGFDAVYAPENLIDLDAAVPGKERPARWRPYPDGLGSAFIQLGTVMRPQTNVAAYALTLVHSPAEQPAALRFGTDDAVKIWLDDAPAYADRSYHGATFDQAAVGVMLRQGWNKLLVKVTQGDGAWRFCLRITAPDGAPLRGLRIETDPEQVRALLASLEPRASIEPVEIDDPVAVFKRRAEEQPESAEAFAALGALYTYKLAFETTDELHIKAYERAIELDPGNWRTYEAIAPLYPDRNKSRNAMMKVVELAPRYAGAHVWLGRYYLDHGFFDKALAEFETAVRLDRADYQGLLGLADYKTRFLHGAEAAQTIEALRAKYPAVPVLVERRFSVDPFSRSDDADIALCNAMLRTDASHEQARRVLIGVARRRGDCDEVLRQLHALQAFNPADTGLLVEEARLLGDRGDFAAAIALLDRVTTICPDDAEPHDRIGRYAHWAGDDERARAAWTQALALRPQNAPLKEYVEHLQPDRTPFEDDYAAEVATMLDAQPAAADYPDEGAVIMLDLQVHEVHPTGLAHDFGQRVVKILTKRGVEAFNQQYVGFSPDSQEVKIQAARIYKPSGEIIEAEAPFPWRVPAGPGGVYYDFSVMVSNYPKLEPGDVLEFRYRRNTVTETNLYATYFGNLTTLRGEYPVQHVKLVFIAPKEREFFYQTVHADLEPTIVEAVGRSGYDQRIYTWEATDLAKIKPEPNMPGPTELVPYVHISTFRDWRALLDWYWGLVQDQFTLDRPAKEKVAELIAGKTTAIEKVTAVHSWVVQNTRYIGLEFGIHGHKPYKVSQIFARGYGDCKDKASLMYAMLKEAGVDSNLVLIRTADKGDVEDFPMSLALFNHAILYVPELDLYLDGTAEFSGTKELPPNDEGATVLRVAENDRQFAKTPVSEPGDNVVDDTYTITLGPSNDVELEGARTMAGAFCAYYRYQFQEEAKRREQLEKQWRQTVAHTEITEVTFNNLINLEEPVTYTYKGRAPDLLTDEGDGVASFKLLLAPQDLAKEYAPLAEREYDVVIPFKWTVTKTMRYVLPEGATVVDLPEPFQLETKLIDASIDSEVTDGAVVVESTVTLKANRIPVDEYTAFREACRTIDEKQSERIRIAR